MSPEREPMENDSNSRTAEELEQQTVDVYVERALHGPVFRMSYEHTHTYCEIFYLKSGTCTYTVNQGQWHLEAGDLFIVAAGDPHSTRYEGKTSCERIIVFCKSDVLAGMMRGDPTEVQQALERSCKVILNAETRTMVEALLDQMLLETTCRANIRSRCWSWNRCIWCCFCCGMAFSAMKPCLPKRATAPTLSAR